MNDNSRSDVDIALDHGIAQMKAVLAGKPAVLQGALIGEALAMWLAGHHVPGDEEATRKMRAELLADLCGMVRDLVPINARIIGTTP